MCRDDTKIIDPCVCVSDQRAYERQVYLVSPTHSSSIGRQARDNGKRANIKKKNKNKG